MIGELVLASLIIPIFLFIMQLRREYYWLQSMGGISGIFEVDDHE